MSDLRAANRRFEMMMGGPDDMPREDRMNWEEMIRYAGRRQMQPVSGTVVAEIYFNTETEEIEYRSPEKK